MTESQRPRPPEPPVISPTAPVISPPAPVISPPAPFVERRQTFRRKADQGAHRETALLARALDTLAVEGGAETRLGGLLDLLARTVGARRAAVLAEGPSRRVAVSRGIGEPAEPAEDLAAWLDAWAPRPRTHRAASGRAPVAIVVAPERHDPAAASSEERHYACLPIASAGGVVLGFDFGDERAAAELETRLPPQLARHAAVALALVTEQLATEREVQQLRAQEAERNGFVSTVAHELRTPLTGLSGYLELILGGQVADEADELDFLERSRQIVETMSELVGDLLELSRLESGTLRFEIGPFSLAEVASRVVGGLTPVAMSRGVELATSLPPRIKTATGDRRRVEQVLTNLVGNALKFAPSGSTIDVEASVSGGVAVVAVRDEGPGIGPDDRTRIFERFHRLADHDRIAGTGLGLPIARDLARRMSGDIDVASVPGTGSCFVLVLPGPVGASADEVCTTLQAALAAEEVRLEEKAVLRSITGPSKPIPTILATEGRTAPKIGSPAEGRSLLERAVAIPTTDGGDDARRPAERPVLRSIDGLASRGTGPRPA